MCFGFELHFDFNLVFFSFPLCCPVWNTHFLFLGTSHFFCFRKMKRKKTKPKPKHKKKQNQSRNIIKKKKMEERLSKKRLTTKKKITQACDLPLPVLKHISSFLDQNEVEHVFVVYLLDLKKDQVFANELFFLFINNVRNIVLHIRND